MPSQSKFSLFLAEFNFDLTQEALEKFFQQKYYKHENCKNAYKEYSRKFAQAGVVEDEAMRKLLIKLFERAKVLDEFETKMVPFQSFESIL